MSEVIDIQDPYWFADDEELDEPELQGLVLDSDDLDEEYVEWTPSCSCECECCGCIGLCDLAGYDEDIDYEEEDE